MRLRQSIVVGGLTSKMGPLDFTWWVNRKDAEGNNLFCSRR